MAVKARGQNALIRIAVDGVVQGGSFTKVKDFMKTPRTTLNEDDYLGENETDIDSQHHGWDIGFSIDTTDGASIDYTDDLITRFELNQAPPDVTITVITTFPEPTARGRTEVFHGVFLKQDEDNIGGRKEIIKGKYSGKCKRREVIKN